MELKEYKLLFTAGDLKQCQVVPVPFQQDEWMIVLTRKNGQKRVLETQRGGMRQFKKLDAAWSAATQIGFRSIEVSTVD